MPSNPISTGMPKLDKDLQDLLGALGDERRAATIAALANHSLSSAELMSQVGEGTMRLGMMLVSTEDYGSLRERCAQDSRELLDRANELAQRYLESLPKHPAAASWLANRAEEIAAKRNTRFPNAVVALRANHQFIVESDALVAATRVHLLGAADNILLDMTLDGDDIAFLIEGLSSVLEVLVGKCAAIDGKGLNIVSGFEDVGKRGKSIVSCWERIVNVVSSHGSRQSA